MPHTERNERTRVPPTCRRQLWTSDWRPGYRPRARCRERQGFGDLLHSKFKIGADAAASAGPVGRNAAASTDVLLSAELLTYSRSKGLFAGVDLNGAVVSQNVVSRNVDDTNLYYGRTAKPYEDILQGKVVVPHSARHFVRTVARYFHALK